MWFAGDLAWPRQSSESESKSHVNGSGQLVDPIEIYLRGNADSRRYRGLSQERWKVRINLEFRIRMGPETRNRNLDASQGDWEDCQNPEQEDGRPSGITGTHITAGPRGGMLYMPASSSLYGVVKARIIPLSPSPSRITFFWCLWFLKI